jgi:hypothetical protein
MGKLVFPGEEGRSMVEQTYGDGLRFTVKEVLLTVSGTALALGSLKAEDPWVVIPMLSVAAVAFICLCVLHDGPRLYRIGVAFVIVLVLLFIGWRDLRHTAIQDRPVALSPLPPSINQTATDSPCANQVAQSGSQINCDTPKEKHDKTKVNH